MPVFGFGPTIDLTMFLLPFAAMWVLKKIACPNIMVAPAGFIIVGILSVLTQRIEYRYGVYHEGAVAVGVGIFYIVAAGISLFFGNRVRSNTANQPPQ